MAAHYTPVSLSEIQGVLKAEKGWSAVDLPKVEEHVFDWTVAPYEAVVRVYSSVRKDTGVSRSCGKDAIRVCAVDLATDKGLVKTTRIHRTPGWNGRLKERVMQVLQTAKKRLAGKYPNAGKPKPKYDNPVPVDPAAFQFPPIKYKKDRLAWMRERLATPEWALWGLGEIAARQTEEEYNAEATVMDNGVGFSGVDAEILTSFDKQFKERGWLSPKQSKLLLSKMPKYAKQLLGILSAMGVEWDGSEPEPPAPQTPPPESDHADTPSPDDGAVSAPAPSPSFEGGNPDEVIESSCHKCHGTGRYVVQSRHGGWRDLGPCYTCDGKGHVTRRDTWRNAAYWEHRLAAEVRADSRSVEWDHGPSCDCEMCLESRAAADYERRMHGRD